MKLVLTTNGQPVKTGDIVQLQNGSRAMVLGANPPCKANLVGSVYIQSLDERRVSREVYPSALSAVFSTRETMG